MNRLSIPWESLAHQSGDEIGRGESAEVVPEDVFGLVTGERRGTWVYYAMDRATVARLGEFQKLVSG